LVDALTKRLYNLDIDSNKQERTMFKKLIITAVILATATSAMARDITVTFADDSKHQYNNTPDRVTPEQIQTRVAQDFPGKQLVNIDGGSSGQGAMPSETCGTGCKLVIGALVLGGAWYVIRHAHVAAAHPCVLPTDRAKDGSLCGGRASSVRPGGN
jgi:hypothetical protein